MPNAPRFLAPLLALALSAPMLQGCYGKFNLTRKLYNWNGTVGDKWINSLVLFALNVIPVYGAAGFVDYVILNVIEFWTGNNPVVMAPGERQIQVVEREGKKYIVTASQNRLDVAAAEGDPRAASLVFDPADKSWYAESVGKRIKLAEAVDPQAQVFDLIHPDGTKERVSLK